MGSDSAFFNLARLIGPLIAIALIIREMRQIGMHGNNPARFWCTVSGALIVGGSPFLAEWLLNS